MTYKEMCEQIADELNRRNVRAWDGKEWTGNKVWNVSPTGELFPIFEMYETLFPDSELAKQRAASIEKTLKPSAPAPTPSMSKGCTLIDMTTFERHEIAPITQPKEPPC